MSQGATAFISALFHLAVPACMQEALFQLQLQQAEAGARHCTGLVGAQGQVLGQDPPSPLTVERLKAARQAMWDQHDRDAQEAATHRCAGPCRQWECLHCSQGLLSV